MSSRRVRSLLASVAVAAGLALAASPSLAGGKRIEASGSGQGTAGQFVTYLGIDGVLRDVASIGTVGNDFSFGFTATRDGRGNVQGQMQLTDHVTGMSINSDVKILEVHGTHGPPNGEKGKSFRMVSSAGGVEVDGDVPAGWKFVNSPTFDGGPHGADTVCFELFNADGVKILQWSAFVSAGNVQFRQRGRGDDDD